MVCSVGAGGGAVTVSDAVPLIPDEVAVIVTGPPPAIPVATPVLLTMVARVVLLEVQAACVVTFLVVTLTVRSKTLRRRQPGPRAAQPWRPLLAIRAWPQALRAEVR